MSITLSDKEYQSLVTVDETNGRLAKENAELLSERDKYKKWFLIAWGSVRGGDVSHEQFAVGEAIFKQSKELP